MMIIKEAEKRGNYPTHFLSGFRFQKIHSTYFRSLQMPKRSSVLSTLYDLFSFTKTPPPPTTTTVGFLPRSPPKADVSTSPLQVLAPIPIVYLDNGYYSTSDECGSLSTSISSTNSSLSSSVTTIMDDTSSMSALSDILCEHYVQTTRDADNNNESASSSQLSALLSSDRDVPLETFSVFEAAFSHIDEEKKRRWMIWADTTDSPREWKRVDITAASSDVSEPEKTLTTTTTTASGETKTPVPYRRHHRRRDIRANTAHLRMIVAEINMMRANKIICPLRPRTHLDKRADEFQYQPSPLRITV